jgi:flagellar basal body-associated protein FliL
MEPNTNNTNPINGANSSTNKANESFNPQFMGMPKQSILSQQANLNTGNVARPASTPTPASTQASLSASSAKPTNVNSTPTTASNPFRSSVPTPTASSIMNQPESKPLPQFTADTSRNTSAGNMQNMQGAPRSTSSAPSMNSAPRMMGAMNTTGSDHSVILPDMEPTQVTQPRGVNKHLVILIVSVIIIVAILAGGFYYWYANMGGRDVLRDSANTTQSTSNQKINTVPTQPTSAFPAGITQPVSNIAKPASPNSLFAQPNANTKNTNTKALSGADKEKIIAYISTNINRLSPEKSTYGFALDDVQFDGPNHAIISYSDSARSISAAVNVSINDSGSVRVSGFTVLTK